MSGRTVSQRDGASIEPGTDEGMAVMSQVIWDFATPLRETCEDEAAERKAISLAIFIWNATLLPEAEQKRTLANYLSECRSGLDPEALITLSGYVERLVESKRTRFADHREKITQCTFGTVDGNRHIEVGYTLE